MMTLHRAIQQELDDFMVQICEPGASLERVSKAAFTKVRKKLKHTVFIDISRGVLKVFYKEAPFRRYWKGFRLPANDGSTEEVPNSKEIQQLLQRLFKYLRLPCRCSHTSGSFFLPLKKCFTYFKWRAW